MSLLKQFEALTPDEILLIETTLEQSIQIGKLKAEEFNLYYEAFSKLSKSVLFDGTKLDEAKIIFDEHAERIKKFEVILGKIKPLKELVSGN